MRLRLVLAAAGVVVAAAGVGVFVWQSGGDEPESAHDLAAKACDNAEKFDRAVRRNDDIDTVNRALNAARRQSLKAEQMNSQYTGLTSGLEALRVAIDRNDPQAATIGIEVVRNECRYVRAEPDSD